mgnify:CR=1 FL=1
MHIKQGDILNNDELCEVFKCAPQGGMRRSHKTNTLVLVSNHVKSIYADRWEGDILHYTGMGSSGNQSLELTPKGKTKVYISKDETVYFENENKVDVKVDVILTKFVEGMRYVDNK